MSLHPRSWLRRGRFPQRLYRHSATKTATEQLSNARRGVTRCLYMPWILGHGDALLATIAEASTDNLFVPFQLFEGTGERRLRPQITLFARQHPQAYRALVRKHLEPLQQQVDVFLFTFDWHPALRIVAEVCAELQIPRLLIPHESVFMDRAKYYTDPSSHVKLPAADEVLCWGHLQRDIFAERGYPEAQLRIVGAPKFDRLKDFQSAVSRASFHSKLQLDPGRRTLLFAAQPMDLQVDTRLAQKAQQRAIADLLAYTERQPYNLIVRLPPSQVRVLSRWQEWTLRRHPHAALDGGAKGYTFGPHESLFHADITLSANSTMLFEAGLLNRPTVATLYFQFESLWKRLEMPTAAHCEELWQVLDGLENTRGSTFSPEGWHWAAQTFSTGDFDGRASQRVAARISEFARGTRPVVNAAERIVQSSFPPPKTVGVAHLNRIADTQKHLAALIGADRLISLTDPAAAYGSEVYCQWGALPTHSKRRAQSLAAKQGRPTLFVEDGFIRSAGIGLSGQPTLSIIVDDLALYYDGTRESRLERLLERGPELSALQQARAEAAIGQLVAARVSKFNHAPLHSPALGRPERPNVLLIDQRVGDASISFGLANESTFGKMLQDALEQHPEHDVLIKRHPDAALGGKRSHFPSSITNERVHLVDEELNPYCLFEQVEEVYVVTSGMGFEALLAGKRVHCYGMPFYAGWGLTHDKLRNPRRTRARSVSALFHFAYIELSRYYHPAKSERCEVEALIEHMASARQASPTRERLCRRSPAQ